MAINKGRNYAELEMEIFVSCLETYKEKIECKITNKIANKEKLKA